VATVQAVVVLESVERLLGGATVVGVGRARLRLADRRRRT